MDNCVKPTDGINHNIVAQGTTNCQNNTNVNALTRKQTYVNAANNSGVTDPSVTATTISICDPDPEQETVPVVSVTGPVVSTIYAPQKQVATQAVTANQFNTGQHNVSFDNMIEQAKNLVAVVSIDGVDSPPITGSAYPSCSYKPVKF